ncbi:MAG: flavoprotein, partial [Candidatus Nitrosotenuis sp.]
MKLVIGITGSTGVIYGVRILEVLKKCNVQTHVVITE